MEHLLRGLSQNMEIFLEVGGVYRINIYIGARGYYLIGYGLHLKLLFW